MKNRKKISVVISSYDDLNNPVYSGGGAHSVHQLAKRLAKNHKVTVITGTYKNAKNQTIQNIKYIRIGSHILGHKIGQIFYQYAILKYASRYKYDVWIESTMPPFTFSLLPLFCKKPLIAWINMLCSSDMKRKYKIDLGFIEKRLSILYKYMIAPTDWVKSELRKMNKNAEIMTITQGYEPIEQSQKTTKKTIFKNYILFLGRIEVNQKGLDLLLNAISNTSNKTNLIVAGSGSKKEIEKLNNLIKEYGVSSKVKRIGRIQGQQKELLLKNAKAVMITSRFETFSITALEAILHQKPVICFNIPQLSWIPLKYAYKIDPFRHLDLALVIDKIYKTKNIKKISIKEKRKFLKKHDWGNIAKQFDNYISNISI